MDFSVDMIRLSTRLSVSAFNRFKAMLEINIYVNYFFGRGASEYRDNFSVNENLGSCVDGVLDSAYNNFYFAYMHNSEKVSYSEYAKYTFVLEFNPNKCFVEFGLLNYILRNFFNNVDDIQLRSCDVCCDFPDIPIDNFSIDRNRKRYVCDMTGNNGRTIYIGKRGSNGRVKIYDKAAELGLKDKVLSRYEVTLTFDHLYFSHVLFNSFHVDVNLPQVYVNSGQLALIQDAKLRAAVLCIQNGLMSINDFERKFKQKIKNHLEDSSSFVIDDTVKDLISTTILSYVRDLSSQFIDYKALKR